MKYEYSVVIPVYNTGRVLLKLVEKLTDAFEEMSVKSFEIILINDCSPNPETKKYLTKACECSTKVKVIHLGRNFGQQPATLCGIEYSQGNYVITMDDDLQHDPADIKFLIEKQHHDIVIAKLLEKKHSAFKKVASHMKGYFDHIILGKPKHIKMSSFRLLNRYVAENILKIRSPNPFIPALLFMTSLDIVNVPIKHYERAEGTSGYNLKGMIRLFSNLMINNSSMLLTMLGKVGILSSLGSIGYAVFLILRKLITDVEVSGWTSLMVTVLFMGGLILFSVGIVGEYLIRVIQNTELKPPYVVKSIEGHSDV
ncbi:hypothetical protein BM527_16505 [Alteromonas sp. Mex14]|nr:hypothetical protein BM527_16505 [Alteromonas sp. Mex14]